NATLTPDWYLSDDGADLKKWAIPTANLLAGSWISFDEITGFHNPITTGFGLNKAGEQVFISYLPGNASDRVVDAVRFKGQENGVSWGRYDNGEPWWTTTELTRNSSNRLVNQDLVISEVMYNPANGSDFEYIVIHNPTTNAVDLWNGAGNWRIAGDVGFLFPSNTSLAGMDHAVLVSFDPADTIQLNAFLLEYNLTNIMLNLFGPYDGRLSNKGGRVALERPQAPDDIGDFVSWVIVDEMIYFDRQPWPEEPDGFGQSLHRLDPGRAGNNPANWAPGNPSPTSNVIVLFPRIVNGVAASIDTNSALVHGLLASTGQAPTEAILFWGTNDGGTVQSAWDHQWSIGFQPAGLVQIQLTGLTQKTDYFYTWYATNSVGDHWAEPSGSFRTANGNNRWLHKMRMAFPGYTRPEPLTNFPALVAFSTNKAGFNYADFGAPDGSDLRFFDASETVELSYEIESWDPNGTSFVWVRVPELTSNTWIWAWWGNEAAGELGPPAYTADGSVWQDHYHLVSHLHDDAADSTANRLDGTASGSTHSNAVIANGSAFDGANDYVSYGDVDALDTAGAFSVSLWFNRLGNPGNASNHGINNVLVAQSSAAQNDNFEIGTAGANMEIYVDSTGQDGPNNLVFNQGITDATWTYLTFTYDSTRTPEGIWYFDGIEAGTYANWGGNLDDSFGSPLSLGIARAGSSDWGDFDGLIDEFRISLTEKSSNWIWACWANQRPGSTFLTCDPAVPVNQDVDGDGMWDSWEEYHFGSITNSSGIEDQDGDDFIDLHEFLAGTTPTDNLSLLVLFIDRGFTPDQVILQWSSEPGKTYSILESSSLTGPWSPRATGIPATPPFNLNIVPVNGSERLYYVIL
ncbi:MAG: DUF2341 domain-containing protein, partial [Verrucomicrobiota bacterium]